MDSTRLTVIKKTVRFAEHNEVFLFPPRESSPQNHLTNPFPHLFYWKMPSIRTSRPHLTAFSSDELFRFSSNTTDIRHVYLLLAGNRHLCDNYVTFILLWQMIKQQQEEAEWRRQVEINAINLLHKFTQATFEEACFDGLNNILQPIIHMRWERDHRPWQRTDFPPFAIPSNLSSLPSPQQPRWPSIPSHSSDHSNSSTPRAPVGSFHNPIVVDDDNSNNNNAWPLDNTQCCRCHRYIFNSFHSEEYCDTIFIPGSPAMVCRWCGLHGHLMLDCREIVCSWCDRLGHIIDNCPNLGWTFRIWNFWR